MNSNFTDKGDHHSNTPVVSNWTADLNSPGQGELNEVQHDHFMGWTLFHPPSLNGVNSYPTRNDPEQTRGEESWAPEQFS